MENENERMMYAFAIVLCIVVTMTIIHFVGQPVMNFLQHQLGPFLLKYLNISLFLLVIIMIVIYGLGRNNGRLLRELLQNEKGSK